MDKQTRSRQVRFAMLALATIVTVSMSSAASYPFVSTAGQPVLMGASSPTAAAHSASVQQAIDLRRRPRIKVTGWISNTSAGCWLLDDYVLRIDPGVRIEGDIQTDSFAVVTADAEDDGQLHAQSISLRPLPGEIGYPLEFRCLIQDIQPRYWIVCNRVVLITENSSIQGRPAIGALAEVKGVRLTGGTVLARSIRVAGAGAYAEVEFEGPIESLTDDVWVVNGITVTISPVTVVRGAPELGRIAEVTGILQPDGSVLAQLITVKDEGPSSQVDIEGPVQEIEPTYWQVAGTQVFVNSSTFIDDSRAPAEVGMWAQVRALVRLDRSLLALRIRLSRPD